MPKQKLFDEESEEEVTIKTENEYAKKYDTWREKEEIHKLEQKYGSKALNSDASLSSDSEDESDEPLEVSEETEAQFLKTLALLKTKDPRIYDPGYKFFEQDKEKEPEKEIKTKTLTFADSDDDDDSDGNIFSIEKKAEITAENEPEKMNKNKTTKEGKLKDYLTGKAKHIDDKVEQDLAPLKALWSDPKLNEGEAFLRDYILNKKYLDEGDAGEAEDQIRDDEDLEADEKLVEEQGKFERAYNFRFEEPDEEYLKRFPRTMNYIRPKDERRSRKRAERRARREAERARKVEQIARLKAFKLKEIQEKISKIKEVTGNEDLAFKDEDIEGDFDPEEHDRRMKAIFDEQYYGETDDQKPVFPDLDEELEIENWENYQPEYENDALEENEDGPHCEDADFNMDADYDPKKARENLLEEMKRNLGKKRRNRKKKSKLAKLLSTEKPKYIPMEVEKTYAQYMEEYYKMDCEDIIGGDLPTRFKYREVVPNDYGLTVEEILLADDKELTQWVPLKSVVKHRPESVQKGEVKTYAQKAADVRLKRKVLPSLFKDLPEEPEIVVPVQEASKKKKKKKKNKMKDAEVINVDEAEHGLENNEENSETNGGVIKRRKQNEINCENNGVDVNSGENVEITEKVKKKKKQKQEIHETDNFIIKSETNAEATELEGKKKKKKHKEGGFVIENVQKEEPCQVSQQVNNTNQIQKSEENAKLKRKLDTHSENIYALKKRKKSNVEVNNTAKKNLKMKFKQKDKFKNKQNNDKSDNPLGKLSDERLKAYGLNPKKYRSFLKYKKF